MPGSKQQQNIYRYKQLYPIVPLECRNADGECLEHGWTHRLESVCANREQSYRGEKPYTDCDTDRIQSRQIKSPDIQMMGRGKHPSKYTDDKPAFKRTLKAHFR